MEVSNRILEEAVRAILREGVWSGESARRAVEEVGDGSWLRRTVTRLVSRTFKTVVGITRAGGAVDLSESDELLRAVRRSPEVREISEVLGALRDSGQLPDDGAENYLRDVVMDLTIMGVERWIEDLDASGEGSEDTSLGGGPLRISRGPSREEVEVLAREVHEDFVDRIAEFIEPPV